jgi:hypothetical protein
LILDRILNVIVDDIANKIRNILLVVLQHLKVKIAILHATQNYLLQIRCKSDVSGRVKKCDGNSVISNSSRSSNTMNL